MATTPRNGIRRTGAGNRPVRPLAVRKSTLPNNRRRQPLANKAVNRTGPRNGQRNPGRNVPRSQPASRGAGPRVRAPLRPTGRSQNSGLRNLSDHGAGRSLGNGNVPKLVNQTAGRKLLVSNFNNSITDKDLYVNLSKFSNFDI